MTFTPLEFEFGSRLVHILMCFEVIANAIGIINYSSNFHIYWHLMMN